jgi:hypothetical protein
MQKKILLISIPSIIAVIAVTIGILYVLRPPADTASEGQTDTNTAPIYVVDTSKDYGACTYLDKSVIKEVLGEAATELQGPDNVGRAGRVQTIEGGPEPTVTMDSQTCVYGFVSGGTIENGFNVNNGFSVIASQPAEQKDYDQLIANYNDDVMFEKVEGLGEAAFYRANIGEQYDLASFELVVLDSIMAHTYTINQPAESVSFTAESAKIALQTIATTKNE